MYNKNCWENMKKSFVLIEKSCISFSKIEICGNSIANDVARDTSYSKLWSMTYGNQKNQTLCRF
jgi:hypothetical protein